MKPKTLRKPASTCLNSNTNTIDGLDAFNISNYSQCSKDEIKAIKSLLNRTIDALISQSEFGATP